MIFFFFGVGFNQIDFFTCKSPLVSWGRATVRSGRSKLAARCTLRLNKPTTQCKLRQSGRCVADQWQNQRCGRSLAMLGDGVSTVSSVVGGSTASYHNGYHNRLLGPWRLAAGALAGSLRCRTEGRMGVEVRSRTRNHTYVCVLVSKVVAKAYGWKAQLTVTPVFLNFLSWLWLLLLNMFCNWWLMLVFLCWLFLFHHCFWVSLCLDVYFVLSKFSLSFLV